MGACCVAGCQELIVNEAEKTLVINGKTYTADDYISIDGSTGNIYGEKISTVSATVSGEFATIMKWADHRRALKIRTFQQLLLPRKQLYHKQHLEMQEDLLQ